MQVEAAAELERRSSANWLQNLIAQHFFDLSDEDFDELEELVQEKWEELPEAVKEASLRDYASPLKRRMPEKYQKLMGFDRFDEARRVVERVRGLGQEMQALGKVESLHGHFETFVRIGRE